MYKKHILFLLLILFTTCSNIPTELSYNEELSLESLKKVDDHPLYIMNYIGDYGFDDFLKEGLQSYYEESDQEIHWACTCFSTLNSQGDVILGRNFDWYEHPALLLFTDPPDGYASVSMVDISYLGFDRSGVNSENRQQLLQAPLYPFDGMNEKGVAVGMMAVPQAEGDHAAGKVTIGSLHVIRMVLDYASDVTQAISLLENYNVDFQEGPPVHYLITDASRNSIVVEYLNDELKILNADEPWQVSTNFILSGKTKEEALSSCWRYNRTYTALERTQGLFTQDQAMRALFNVSQANTIWSILYNCTTRDIQVVMARDYEQVYNFKLRN